MTASTEYGKALFEIAEETGRSDEILNDLGVIKQAFADSPDFVKLLDTPAIPKDERTALAERAFGTLDRNLTNLVMILAEKHLSYLLPKIYDEYSSLYDESRGIERVEVISAVPLSESQSKSLVSRLEKLCEKTVKLHCTVDPSVLGGMKVRYSGIQLDGTVKARLDSFRESLKNIVI